jgi:hypothetical protein
MVNQVYVKQKDAVRPFMTAYSNKCMAADPLIWWDAMITQLEGEALPAGLVLLTGPGRTSVDHDILNTGILHIVVIDSGGEIALSSLPPMEQNMASFILRGSYPTIHNPRSGNFFEKRPEALAEEIRQLFEIK